MSFSIPSAHYTDKADGINKTAHLKVGGGYY